MRVAGNAIAIYHPVARLAPFHQLSRSLATDYVDLREPSTLPTVQRLAWWRRLPLTGQLGLVGLVVAVAWFLTARMAADRAQVEMQRRNADLARLQSVEIVAGRLLTNAVGMVSRARGFVLSGDEGLSERYDQSRDAFLTDVQTLRELSDSDATVGRRLDRVFDLAARWDRDVVRPNFRLRRTSGLAAFQELVSSRPILRLLASRR
jgi:CHASE3 domain sensor protein